MEYRTAFPTEASAYNGMPVSTATTAYELHRLASLPQEDLDILAGIEDDEDIDLLASKRFKQYSASEDPVYNAIGHQPPLVGWMFPNAQHGENHYKADRVSEPCSSMHRLNPPRSHYMEILDSKNQLGQLPADHSLRGDSASEADPRLFIFKEYDPATHSVPAAAVEENLHKWRARTDGVRGLDEAGKAFIKAYAETMNTVSERRAIDDVTRIKNPERNHERSDFFVDGHYKAARLANMANCQPENLEDLLCEAEETKNPFLKDDRGALSRTIPSKNLARQIATNQVSIIQGYQETMSTRS